MTEPNDSKEELNGNIDYSNYLLDPDHPILAPFQKALKEHLQAQIDRLKDELFEMEDDIKKKETEIVDVGVKAYEVQQQVCAQQKTLDGLINDIQTVSAAQQTEEENLKANTKELKEIQNKLYQTEKCNRELINEIDGLGGLTRQLTQSETQMESHITISKRKVEKSRKDNDQLANDKRRQDYLIHQLTTDVWNVENEIETSNHQLRLKEEEVEEMEQKIALGSTNITALQSELKALMFSWTSVLCAVGNRDKGLECLNKELNKQEEKHKSILTEIGVSKKLIKKEHMENQRFTSIKERIYEDIKNNRILIEEQTNLKMILDKEYHDVEKNMEQMDKDIKKTQQDYHMKKLAYNSIEYEYKKLANNKSNIEQEIFQCIKGEIANDLYGKKAVKTLKDIEDKRQDIEVMIYEAENKRTLLHSEIESQKFKINELNHLHDETKEQLSETDDLANRMKAEFRKYELLYRKREKQVLMLNEKLEQKLALNELDTIARAEMKINDLTKLIDESQQAIKTLQVFWMREQKNILTVSKERQDQIHEISLLKKQVLILEQKNVRICDKIDELKNREEKTQHSINILTNRAAILCDMVYKSKTKKNCLDRDNAFLQGKYDFKLKDAELELLQIEGEIADIEEEKLSISQELIAINREGLEWEKKFQLARDAVKNLRFNQKCGDAANMRMEIHKMQVIYEQLRKAQEKLLKDLQQTVLKRTMMYQESDIRQATDKLKKNGDRSKINIQKKLDNLKNKIKQVKNETQSIKNKYKQVINGIEEAHNTRELLLKEPVLDKKYKTMLKKKLDDSIINRQFKFELLVFQQKKANMYSHIAENRTPYTVYRKEADLITEYNKQKDINNKLLKVTDVVKSSFPDRANDVQRLCNTLAIVSLCMYT